jgi:rod shape-determining protein MreC
VTDRRILILRTVLLWLLLELLAAAQVRTPGGQTVLWSWARAAASPVVWLSERIGVLFTDLITGFTQTRELAISNRQLELELDTARIHRMLMAEDLAALLELDSLIAAIPSLKDSAVPSRITYRNLIQGQMIARVPSGEGLERDTPALAGGGVIGRVIRSERRNCWIELITHPVAAVAVQTPDGTIQGLSVGSEMGDLEIQFVPRQARLLRGTTLFTSGADGIYPPGLPVGRVTVVRESADAFLEIRAEPTADLSASRVVVFIKDWALEQPMEGLDG